MAYDVELKVKDLTQMYKQADGWEPDGNTLIITGDLKNVERLLTCPFVVDAIYISFIRSWAGSYLVQIMPSGSGGLAGYWMLWILSRFR